MNPTPKQLREAEAHDRLAETHYQHLAEDQFQMDPVIQGLLDKAGDLHGLRVLECGCGRGLFTQYLVSQGATVVAFDISEKMVELARSRLAGNPDAQFMVGAIEVLDLEPASFDLVLGLDILHHIDLPMAMPLIRRWLKPDGSGLFVENLGFNPLLVWARQLLAGRMGVAKYGTDDERPLSRSDVKVMRRSFERVHIFVPQMVFLHIFARNVLRYRHARWLQKLLDATDTFLYRFPALHWLSYKAVVILQ